jgi:hypothetical protein
LKKRSLTPGTVGPGHTRVIAARVEPAAGVSTRGWRPKFDPPADDAATR